MREKNTAVLKFKNNGWARINEGSTVSRLSPLFLPTLFFWKIPNLILYKTIEKCSVWTTLCRFCQMKSKDLQKLVLSKYDNGDGTTKIFLELNGAISLSTIKRWCRSIREVGTIDLVNQRRYSRTIRTKTAIQKTIKSTKATFLSKISSWIGYFSK